MSIHYHLEQFPPGNLHWEELIPLLGPASAALARYDGLLQAIPNPQVLLAPLTTQEAVLSSRIEGTQATASEVFEFEADEARFTGERRDDFPSARRILRILRDENILWTVREPSGRSPGIFSFRELLRRAEGDFADHE